MSLLTEINTVNTVNTKKICIHKGEMASTLNSHWMPWIYKTPDNLDKWPASAPPTAYAASESSYGYRYKLRVPKRKIVSFNKLRVGGFYARVDIGPMGADYQSVELFHINVQLPSGAYGITSRYTGRHTLTRETNEKEKFYDYTGIFVEAKSELWYIKPDGNLVKWKP